MTIGFQRFSDSISLTFQANRDPAHPSPPSASCLASNPKFAQEDPRSGKLSAVGSPIGSDLPEQLFPTISAKFFFQGISFCSKAFKLLIKVIRVTPIPK